MEEPGESVSLSPPPPFSRWQRLKGLGFKKLFLVCVGIGAGLGIGIIATVASVVWITSRPIPAREWPEVEGAGLRAKLKTDWNDSVRYQLVVTPRSSDLKTAFDNAVRTHRDSIAFTIHLYDKAGFELCKKDVKPRPFVDDNDHYAGLHATETFYSFECSRTAYKGADRWNISYIFPALTADGATQNNAKAGLTASKATAPADTGPAEGDDTLTGFDLYSGHLETRSGKTFVVYREGEKSTAEMWNIEGQDSGQPQIHFNCKTRNDCLIENTKNNQVVHGRLVR
jgi:hypothetical protein